jgi:hypothetical protein
MSFDFENVPDEEKLELLEKVDEEINSLFIKYFKIPPIVFSAIFLDKAKLTACCQFEDRDKVLSFLKYEIEENLNEI